MFLHHQHRLVGVLQYNECHKHTEYVNSDADFLENGQVWFLSLNLHYRKYLQYFYKKVENFANKKCVFPCDAMHIPVSFMCTSYLPRILRCSFSNCHLVTAGPKHQ